MTQQTLNEAWMDALVRHQVGLARLGSAMGNRVNALLRESEADLRARLEKGLSTGMSPGKLKATLKTLELARGDAFDKASGLWETELEWSAINEPYFLDRTLKTLSPVELQSSLPNLTTLQGIATSTPFEGAMMKQWADGLRRADYDRLQRTIQIGLTQGQTGQEIARRIFGTAAALGSDGVLQITRNNAQAISRTAVNSITNEARRLWVDENADIIEWEIFLATLDARTTLICASNDNKKYPRGKGPRPPLHWNCRSLRMPIFSDEAIGERPARPFTEKQLLREYAQKTGTKVVTSRDDLGKGHKGAYDSFARQRKRDLTGQVPAKLSYDQWLRQQSKEFQDEVLGPKRAAIFREGKTLDKFVAKNGDTLTLNQLRGLDEKFTPNPWGGDEPKPPAPPLPDPKVEEAKRRAAEDARRRAEEAEAKRRAEEAERKRLAEQEAERKRLAEEMRKRLEEAERKAKELEERNRQLMREQEEMRKKLAERKPRAPRATTLEAFVKKLPKGATQRFAMKPALEKNHLGTVTPEQEKAALSGLQKSVKPGADVPQLTRFQMTSVNEPGDAWMTRNVLDGEGGFYSGGMIRMQTDPKHLKEFWPSYGRTDGQPNGTPWNLRNSTSYSKNFKQPWEKAVPYNVAAVSKNVDEILENSVIHEYGHHIHMWDGVGSPVDRLVERVYNQVKAEGKGWVSNYAMKNHKEFFAESFNAYHTYPREWMVENAPKALALVEEVFKLRKMV